MSQSDEASPHFEDIIDNYYAGLRYLKKNFQATSNTCWQLDPFGHSKTLNFFAAKFGMKHSVFSRLPGKLYLEWERQQKLDFLWSFPDGTNITAHAHGGYYAPESLGCFDSECEIRSFDQNQFKRDCQIFDKRYSQNSFFTVGGDFHYQKSKKKFEFLDHVISKNSNTNYALMSEFVVEFEKRYPQNKLPVFEDDLFVYQELQSEGAHEWSGYFTTHPRLKRRIKKIGLMLRSVKAFFGLMYALIVRDEEIRKHILKEVSEASEDFGVFMHHDSITGTCVEKVYDDYMSRLSTLETKINSLWGYLSKSEVQVLDSEELLAGTKTKFIFYEDLVTKGESMLVFFNPTSSSVKRQLSIPIPLEFKEYGFSLTVGRKSLPFSLSFPKFSKFGELTFTAEGGAAGGFGVSVKVKKENKQNKTISGPKKAKDSKKVKLAKTILRPKTRITESTNNDFLAIEEYAGQYSASAIESNSLKTSVVKPTHDDVAILSSSFDDFDLVVQRNVISYLDKGSNKFVNHIKYRSRKAVQSGHYILNYKQDITVSEYNEFIYAEEIENEHYQGVYAKGTQVDVWIKRERGSPFFTIKSLVRKDSDELKRGADILLEVTSEQVQNSEFFYTDSNGFFEMKRRVKNSSYENKVYPLSSFIRTEDTSSKVGFAIFPDRAVGATVHETTVKEKPLDSIVFHVQRSASVQDGKGNEEVLKVREDVVVNHLIFNYLTSDKDSNDNFTKAETHFNSLQELFCYRGVNKNINLLSFSKEMDERIRMVLEIVEEDLVLVRLNNVSRTTGIQVNFKSALSHLYSDTVVKEVDFAYVYKDTSLEKELKDSYFLKPQSFLSVLIKFDLNQKTKSGKLLQKKVAKIE
jgi:hypothetical protein